MEINKDKIIVGNRAHLCSFEKRKYCKFYSCILSLIRIGGSSGIAFHSHKRGFISSLMMDFIKFASS